MTPAGVVDYCCGCAVCTPLLALILSALVAGTLGSASADVQSSVESSSRPAAATPSLLPSSTPTPQPVTSWRVGDWSECRDDVDISVRLGCSRTLATRTRSVDCVQQQQRQLEWGTRHPSSWLSSSSSPVAARWQAISESTCKRLLGQRPANRSLCNGPCYRVSGQDYRWVQSEWTKCDYLCHTNNTLQRSLQTRRVSCLHRQSGAVVADSFCVLLAGVSAPRRQRECRFQDADCVDGKAPLCSYDQWSSWTSCRMTCGLGWCKTRSRTPVTFPRNSHRICTDTLQMTSCQNDEDDASGNGPNVEYVLRASPWQPCTSGHAIANHQHAVIRPRDATIYQEPLIGEQQRRVFCLRVPDGAEMPGNYCQHWSVPTDGYMRRLCIIPQDCEVTEWSDWSAGSRTHQLCILEQNSHELVWPSNSIMRRSRKIKIQPFGAGKSCPHLEEERPVSISLAETESLPRCEKLYQWFASDWLDCVVSQDTQSGHLLCGRGFQRRAVFCQLYNDSSRTPVPDDLCVAGEISIHGVHLEKPAVTRPCYKRCIASCRTSEWTSWSACKQPECKENSFTASGTQTRTRVVLTEPQDHGKPCPHLAESRECGYKACQHYEVEEKAGPCGLKEGERPPNGRWGCVYRTAWGVTKRKKCRCSKRCPSWRQIRAQNFWVNYTDCEPVGQRNATTFRRVSIRAHFDETLRSCPTEFDTQSCVPKPKKRKPLFAWHADNFPLVCQKEHRKTLFPFDVKEAPLPSCKVCGKGLKYRPVYCVRIDPATGEKRRDPQDPNEYAVAHNSKCPPKELYKPHDTETCHICCSQPCKFSAWAAWGSCQADVCTLPHLRYITNCSSRVTCAVSAAGHRTRIRYQLSLTNDGSVCRDHHTTQRCTIDQSLCYSWQVGNWSRCNHVSQLPCLGGFRTRTVFCKQSDGRPVTADKCAHLERPDAAELCNKQCDELCLFTQWSSWSKCSETQCSTGHRTRTRQMMLSMEMDEALAVLAKPCGTLRQTELCSKRACKRYKTKYTSWGAWTPRTGPHGRCRHMEQHRIIRCYDRKGRRRVPLDYCPRSLRFGQTIKHHSRDAPPCQYGCELTQWQAWTSSCDQPCGHGWLYRTRFSLRNKTSDGRPCPKDIVQKKPCFRQACADREFTWHADPWTPCRHQGQPEIIDNEIVEPECFGMSIQTRRIMCLEILQNGEKPIVNDSLCYQAKLRRPKASQTCLVVCPDDCQWSDWGAWSTCEGGIKRRDRVKIRERVRNGMQCYAADTSEKKHCSQKGVRTFQTSVGEWTGCQQIGDDSCGPGVDRRLAVCHDSKGRLARNASTCPGLAAIETVRPCSLPCNRDCELSEWSDWSTCLDKCDTTRDQHRTRKVIRKERGTGKPCPPPDELVEKRDCLNSKPCFKSKVYAWSQCLIDGADCGEGVRVRRITCRRQNDNELVSPLKCFANELGPNQKLDQKLMLITETEPCRRPCPDECQYTPWSDWSLNCIANCNSRINNSRVYKGRRVAYRSILSSPDATGSSCKERLWISRQCRESFCMTFEWKTSEWQGTERGVWCQRSDGLRVTDEACMYKERPNQQRCHPSCSSDQVCIRTVCFAVIHEGKLCVGESCPSDPTAVSHRERRDVAEQSDVDVTDPCLRGE